MDSIQRSGGRADVALENPECFVILMSNSDVLREIGKLAGAFRDLDKADIDSCIINPRSDEQVEVDIRSYCIGCAKEHTWRLLLSRVFLIASGIVTD